MKMLLFLLVGGLCVQAQDRQSSSATLDAGNGFTAPRQATGYTLAFSDNFDQLNLSPSGTGNYAWYQSVWWDNSFAPASSITDSDGVLNLQWNRGQVSADTTISTFAHNASQGLTFRYGYFEARMRWDVVTGAWPAFWLIPKQAASGAQETGEVDVFEGQGSDRNWFYGTIHNWTGRSSTMNTPNYFVLPATNDFSQWHTYGLLWVPGKVSWYYDNQFLYSADTPSIFDQQDFFLVFSMKEGANWKENNLQGVSAQQLNLQIDWVRVWRQ